MGVLCFLDEVGLKVLSKALAPRRGPQSALPVNRPLTDPSDCRNIIIEGSLSQPAQWSLAYGQPLALQVSKPCSLMVTPRPSL